MLKNATISVAAVVSRLEVALSTLHSHIPHARSVSLEGGADIQRSFSLTQMKEDAIDGRS
jgi:hypothetical protein